MGSEDIIETSKGLAVHTNDGLVTTATKVKDPAPVAPPSPPSTAAADTPASVDPNLIQEEPVPIPSNVEAIRDLTAPDLLKFQDEAAVKVAGPVTPESLTQLLELDGGDLMSVIRLGFEDTIGVGPFLDKADPNSREARMIQIKAANYSENHGVQAFMANMITGVLGEGFIDVIVALGTATLGNVIIGASRAVNASRTMVRLGKLSRRIRQSYKLSGSRPGLSNRLLYRSGYEFSVGATSAAISESMLQVGGKEGDFGTMFERMWVEGLFSVGFAEGGRQVYKVASPYIKKRIRNQEEAFDEDIPPSSDNREDQRKADFEERQLEDDLSFAPSDTQINPDDIQRKLKTAPVEDVPGAVTETEARNGTKQAVADAIAKEKGWKKISVIKEEEPASTSSRPRTADKSRRVKNLEKLIKDTDTRDGQSLDALEDSINVVELERAKAVTDVGKSFSIIESLNRTIDELTQSLEGMDVKSRTGKRDVNNIAREIDSLQERVRVEEQTASDLHVIGQKLSDVMTKLDDQMQTNLASIQLRGTDGHKGILITDDILEPSFGRSAKGQSFIKEQLVELGPEEVARRRAEWKDTFGKAAEDADIIGPMYKSDIRFKQAENAKTGTPRRDARKKKSKTDTDLRKEVSDSKRQADRAVREALNVGGKQDDGVKLTGLGRKELTKLVSSFLKKSHKRYASFIVDLIEARAESAGLSLDDYLARNNISLKNADSVKLLIRDGANIVNAVLNKTDIFELVHELAHVIRGDLDASQMGFVAKQLKIEKWDVEGEEKFADALVEHIRDRTQTSPALRSIFDKAVKAISKFRDLVLSDGNREAAKGLFESLFKAPSEKPFAVPSPEKVFRREVTELSSPKKPIAKRKAKVAGAEVGVDIPSDAYITSLIEDVGVDISDANKQGGTIDTSPGKFIPKLMTFFDKSLSLVGLGNINTQTLMHLAGDTYQKYIGKAQKARDVEAELNTRNVRVINSAIDRVKLTGENMRHIEKTEVEISLDQVKTETFFRTKKDGKQFKKESKRDVKSQKKIKMTVNDWLHLHLTASDTFGTSSGAHSLEVKGFETRNGEIFKPSKEQVAQMADDEFLKQLGPEAKKLKSVVRSVLDHQKNVINNLAVRRGQEAPLSVDNKTFYMKATKGDIKGKPTIAAEITSSLFSKGNRLILGEIFSRESFNLRRKGAGKIHMVNVLDVTNKRANEVSKAAAWSDTGAIYAAFYANTQLKIEKEFGKKYANHLEDTVKRMNNSKPTNKLDESSFTKFALQAQVVHALWLNLGVFVKQRLSIITAAIEGNAHFAAYTKANPDWAATLFKEAGSEKLHTDLLDSSNIYSDRWHTGGSTPNTNEGLSTGYFRDIIDKTNTLKGLIEKIGAGGKGGLLALKDFGLLPIKLNDAFTIRFVFLMAEKSVDPALTGAKKSRAIEKEFNRLVIETQPTFDSVFKTSNQASDNIFVRSLSQFTSQPSKHLGIVVRDFADYQKAKAIGTPAEVAKTKKKLVRTYKGLVLNSAAFAAMGVLFATSKEAALSLMDSKADERKRKKALEQYGGIFQQFVTSFARTAFGTAPIGGAFVGEAGIALLGGSPFGPELPVLESANGTLDWLKRDEKFTTASMISGLKAVAPVVSIPRIGINVLERSIGSGE